MLSAPRAVSIATMEHAVVLVAPNGREQAARLRACLEGLVLSTPELQVQTSTCLAGTGPCHLSRCSLTSLLTLTGAQHIPFERHPQMAAVRPAHQGAWSTRLARRANTDRRGPKGSTHALCRYCSGACNHGRPASRCSGRCRGAMQPHSATKAGRRLRGDTLLSARPCCSMLTHMVHLLPTGRGSAIASSSGQSASCFWHNFAWGE